MSVRRLTPIVLAAVVLVAGNLACNMPEWPSGTEAPAATVPPGQTPQSPPGETQQPPPAGDTPQGETPTEEPPPPAPTNTPPPPAPTNTPEPEEPVSEGPLDFEEPTSLYHWEEAGGGKKRVVLKIAITGGAPPFTIKHDGLVDGTTMDREYFLEWELSGCTAIVHTIAVESADGQTATHDYYIGTDLQPWCD